MSEPRLARGERQRRVLEQLAAKPWQTTKELGIDTRTMARLRAKKLVRRRVGNRRFNELEYALATEKDPRVLAEQPEGTE